MGEYMRLNFGSFDGCDCLTCIQIFDEEPVSGNEPGGASNSNAIFIVQSYSKVSVDLDDPGKPAPGTVNEGYDENMDKPRPSYLDEYLESVFISLKGKSRSYITVISRSSSLLMTPVL
jgi:hypothetical protein